MSVATLNPQDFVRNIVSQHTLDSFPMKSPRNPNSNRDNRTQNRRRRRGSPPPAGSEQRSRNAAEKPSVSKLVMGQVKILKRGEELKQTTPDLPSRKAADKQSGGPKAADKQSGSPKAADKQSSSSPKATDKRSSSPKDLGSTNRLGPDPQMVTKQIRVADSNKPSGFFAGSSACIASPPPSSLPLPVFFTKKSSSPSKDEATNALLKMLRLDLAS